MSNRHSRNVLKMDLQLTSKNPSSVNFLCYVIDGIKIRNAACKSQCYSRMATTYKEERGSDILGFANYYRQFIQNYSTKIKPLIELTRDIPFSWGQ